MLLMYQKSPPLSSTECVPGREGQLSVPGGHIYIMENIFRALPALLLGFNLFRQVV